MNTELSISKNRMLIIVIFIFALYMVPLSKLVWMMYRYSIVQKNKQNNTHDTYNFYNKRINIIDRNGIIIASSLPTFSLYANAKKIKNIENAIKGLYGIMPDIDVDRIRSSLIDKKNFVWIKRHLVPKEQEKILKLGIPGVYIINDEKRIYPQGSLFSHIIGYTDQDGNGLAGVERYFDSFLKNKDSTNVYLQLSVDVGIQHVVRKILVNNVNKYNASGGVAIVSNLENCEAISMVSVPDFDLNSSFKDNIDEMFNRFSLGLYEMGSTFKCITFAAAIESGISNLDDIFEIGTHLKISNRVIHDFILKKPKMTMEEIFLYSSNIGTAKLAMMMGFDVQYSYLKKLGFFDQLSLEIGEKAMPILPKDKVWNDVVVSTISYGHGISITPVHLVEGFSSVIGNGESCKITLVKGKNVNNIREKIFSHDTVLKMRYLLGKVVTHGTGRKAMINGYSVGGKTGSADKVVSGMYDKNKVVTSFVAGFPINDPKYVVLVMLDEPKSISGSEKFTGGHLSAPIVKNIIIEIAPMLGVSPLALNK